MFRKFLDYIFKYKGNQPYTFIFSSLVDFDGIDDIKN